MGRKSSNQATGEETVIAKDPPRYSCVWIDKRPEDPHMPSAGVMRWDSRGDDWWEFWPELLSHPCAYLFAPKHPNRDGPPKFADWVASWPVGLDWERIVPQHHHEQVREILATLVPSELSLTTQDTGNVVRYAMPESASKALAIDPANENAVMLRLLVKTLLDLPEAERENTARLLSTLALAPDSARTLDALKLSVSKQQKAVV